VDHAQDGVDDQRFAPVSADLLRTLRDTAATVLAHPAQAPQVLPTRDGFFFGSIAYDDGYFDDLHSTVDQLGAVLATTDADRHVLLYHAWW
jgi:hypothetical protein